MSVLVEDWPRDVVVSSQHPSARNQPLSRRSWTKLTLIPRAAIASKWDYRCKIAICGNEVSLLHLSRLWILDCVSCQVKFSSVDSQFYLVVSRADGCIIP